MVDTESEEDASMRFESSVLCVWVPAASLADSAAEADASMPPVVSRVGSVPGMTRVCALLAAGTAATVWTVSKGHH